MRSSWTICTGPIINDKYLSERHPDGDTGTRGEGHVRAEAETTELGSYRQGMLGAPRSWTHQGSILPLSLQSKQGPANSLISDFWPAEP